MNPVTALVGVLGVGCMPPVDESELRRDPLELAEARLVTDGALDLRPSNANAGPAVGCRSRLLATTGEGKVEGVLLAEATIEVLAKGEAGIGTSVLTSSEKVLR